MEMNQDNAEAIAIQALAFIAGSGTLLPRFLQLTGIEASAIRQAAGEPGFLAGVVQFVAAHEPTLIEFCEQSGHAPQQVMRAMRALPLGDQTYQTSI